MPDDRAESSRTYLISPGYREAWGRRAGAGLLIGALLVVVGIVLLATASTGAGVALLVIGVLVGGFAWLARVGVRSAGSAGYGLRIDPDRVTVTWRDQVTELPWTDLEYGQVVSNGPLTRVLEVRPRPGVRYPLPDNARPRASRRNRGNLEVFTVSMLGEQESACLADVASYLPMR